VRNGFSRARVNVVRSNLLGRGESVCRADVPVTPRRPSRLRSTTTGAVKALPCDWLRYRYFGIRRQPERLLPKTRIGPYMLLPRDAGDGCLAVSRSPSPRAGASPRCCGEPTHTLSRPLSVSLESRDAAVKPDTTSVSPRPTRASMSDSTARGRPHDWLSSASDQVAEDLWRHAEAHWSRCGRSRRSLFSVSSRGFATMVTVPCSASRPGACPRR